ncbi:hypothetical protein MYSTI_02193 [Myxococcus stipitatus DSM 14675]|uniref:Uncharacterized protein n=1 Tax=Myxococcus stipitatus (strain DSM 14675 / JCM 12634 / Mx s8) TaxID=1278073 RepID=L7U6R2_MYXSD|nr:hypothetical protein [Myxococcus stipitatus]AGC43520.1 hypothetical protein MYSTI_02193 [Myxococcus stipitatus DSM 14675]
MSRTASDAPQQALEELGRRLEARGFVFAPRAFFASNGIIVSRPLAPRRGGDSGARESVSGALPLEYTPADIKVVLPWVALYFVAAGWEARVTAHGGPHWIRRAERLDALEGFVEEALRVPEGTCPGEHWCVVEE